MALWIQADIDSLKAAVATGTLTVLYDGPPRRMITYQSLAEMRALLASMVQDVQAQAGKTSHKLAGFRKGTE